MQRGPGQPREREPRRSPTRKSILASLAILATALATAGCGGSSGDSGSTGAPLASSPPVQLTPVQAAFFARAEPICARLNSAIAKVKPNGSGVSEIAKVTPARAALEQRTTSELSKLAPPASLARVWRQIVAYRRALAAELVTLVHYAKANDTSSIQALAASKKKLHEQLHAVAARSGFSECAVVG